jgi:hypothetical protein
MVPKIGINTEGENYYQNGPLVLIIKTEAVKKA